jgi:short-subunit dehydrogenase
VLINNAGFGDFCLVECAAWEKLDRMITLNVAALTLLTQHLLGPMVERGRGGILNVSSGFGLTFLPGFASYVGTKHYVTAFTEALRTELRGTGVVVSQVCPGPVDTEFDQVTNEVSDLSTPRILSISPERCARAALRGFARGRALIIPGGLIWVLLWLGRLTPRPLLRLVYSVFGRFLRRRLPSRSRPSLPGPKPDAR